MKIIAVDDEPLALKSIARVIKSEIPDCDPACFDTPEEALEYAKENCVDLAFLDIEMAGMNGLTLAKNLKDINGKTNIVFVTGHSQYALDSYSVNASDYLLKPITENALKVAMERLRHPIVAAEQRQISGKRIRIQTFGNFEVFVDGKPLQITLSKPKELLAYLVDKRGTSVSAAEIASVLWEDKKYDRSLQKMTQSAISQLLKILKEAGISEIIVKSWNNIAVDTSKFDCDFYRFLEGNTAAVNSYTGEYMNQYSWAEMTAGMLTFKNL